MSNDQNKKTLDDFVFENRNKEYGAYYLRKNYRSYLTRAVIYGVGIFTLIFGGAFAYEKYKASHPELLEKNVVVDLKDLKQEEQPEDKPLPPPPPPPPPPPAPEVAQVKFLPPEPKKDEDVRVEEPPPPAEKVEKAVISNKTVEGEDAVGSLPPPPEEVKVVAIEKPKEEEIFTAVEQSAEFPGGMSAMYRFLGENIKYPAAAQRANITGKVYVKFVVEKDGSIGNVEVMKGIGFGCDEEAIRVIKSMPRWNPGRQNGNKVRQWYNMPVNYKLE